MSLNHLPEGVKQLVVPSRLTDRVGPLGSVAFGAGPPVSPPAFRHDVTAGWNGGSLMMGK